MTHNDATWRAAAASCPGYATYPDTPPGDPSWWRRTPSRPATGTWRPASFATTDPGPRRPERDTSPADDLTERILGGTITAPIDRVEMHPTAWQALRAPTQPEHRPPPDRLGSVPVVVVDTLPAGAWRVIGRDGLVLRYGHVDGPATTPLPVYRVLTDPFSAPETPADATPTPTPAPQPASAATDDVPPAPPPERAAAPGETLPPPAEPTTPGPQTVGRRQLDPGSPWRWIRQFL
ncbi:hypothetical protein [Micromonospora aurantiaca (nom. illeg.)]|uniref:hypothetical protein n=1 Tax=Micromonospora aurantiaca (nom. illeg.) TaxID=47850 RepID=UPI0033FD63A1